MEVSKICTKCKIEKEISSFQKSARHKDGVNWHCKKCMNAYYSVNKEMILKKQKTRYEKNKKNILLRQKAYLQNFKINNPEIYIKRKERSLETTKNWNNRNPERASENAKKWSELNSDRIKENSKKWRKNNPEKAKQQRRDWAKRNPEKSREIAIKWYKKNAEKKSQRKKQKRRIDGDEIRVKERIRRLKDVNHKIKTNLRSRLYQAVKKLSKSDSTLDLLGCSMDYFKLYFESKFKKGMTWENYGRKWHIDHVIPCSLFDLSNPEAQKVCFHYNNLQPLWAGKNLSKHAKSKPRDMRFLKELKLLKVS